EGGKFWQQMMKLKDKAQLLVEEAGQSFFIHGIKFTAFPINGSFIGTIKAAENMKQGAFTAAACSNYGRNGSFGNRQGGSIQYGKRGTFLVSLKGFNNIFGF